MRNKIYFLIIQNQKGITINMNYKIRPIHTDEIHFLNDFIYEAIFQRDENNLAPRDIIYKPEIWIYVENFGSKPDDLCLVAECDGNIVGAVWTRIISAFGHIDNDTPEFAISLYKNYRGHGIGTEMMREMLKLLKEKRYEKTSLAVQKDNYAVKMYQKVGFKIVNELEEEYLMICKL